MQFFVDNILLIFVLPLIAMAIAFMGKFFKFSFSKSSVVYSSITSSFVGLIFAVALFICFHGASVESCEFCFDWLKLGSFNISMGVLLDSVSTMFLLILMIISIAVQWYSASYMSDDEDFDLFFFLLNLFTFSMMALVLSSNLIQTYVFWEIVGVCGYLLVNYYFKNSSVSKSAKKVLIFDRISDILFLSGLLILTYFILIYPMSGNEYLFDYSSLDNAAADFYVYFSDTGFYWTLMLLFGAALIKSAQFPFQVSLTEAMKAPLPASALIYSSALLSSGIFLCCRLMPLFLLSEMMYDTILYFGLFSASICAFFAVAQLNIKKMLAFSTSSQLGIIYIALTVLSVSSALYYLFTFALANLLLFLIAGLLIKYTANGSSDYIDMKISTKNNPVTALCYFVSILSLSGIFFGGFFAKEILFEKLQITNSVAVVSLFCLICFMTAYYLFKSYFLIFEKGISTVKIPNTLKVPIVAIMFFVVIATYFVSNDLSFSGFREVFEHLSQPVTVYSLVIISLLGVLTAYGVVLKKWESLPLKINVFCRNGAYIDNIFGLFVDFVFEPIAGLVKKIEKHIISSFYNFQATLTKSIAWIISYSQCGNIQSYITISLFVILLILVFCLIIALGLGEI